MKRLCLAKLALGTSLLLFVSGCGPQPKPEDLTQLEIMRQSESSAEINQKAPGAYKICTQLTNQATSAWQEGNLPKAKMYAALGQRQYMTAMAQAALVEEVAKEKAAQEEFNSISQRIDTLEVKREGLEKNLTLQRAIIAQHGVSSVENLIQAAMVEREKAVGVGAPSMQHELFEQAEASLKKSSALNVQGQRKEAMQEAEQAHLLFSKAYALAKPDYDKKVASSQSAVRQKALYNEAVAIVGPSYVYTDMHSTIIVLASAFEKDKSDILPIKLDALRRISELAKSYADATISIEGYAQSRTKNHFEVSQRRADIVRDFLITQGIDYQRIMTTAKGKESPRYDEKAKAERGRNDRIELIITLP